MSNLPYQNLAYCYDELLDYIKENNHIPEKIKKDFIEIDILYWELLILSNTIDKYIDGKYNDYQMTCGLNKFRANTGLINRGE